MTTMKIGEDSQAYAAAAFAFPNNPTVVDIPTFPNRRLTSVPLSKLHIAIDYGGVDPKTIVMNGTLFGTSKRTDYNNLSFHIYDKNLKKFFPTSDRFYYVLGMNVKEVNNGGRTNFIDYVAQLWTPIPFAFADTASTYVITTTSAAAITLNDATAGSTGAFTNAGNAPSFVQWQVQNTGGSAITQIELGDLAISGSEVAGNRKITWTGTLASGSTLIIYMIKYVSQTGGQSITKYAYPEIAGVTSGSIKVDGSISGIPYVNPSATDQAFSMKLTGNAGATVTATYRSAYTG